MPLIKFGDAEPFVHRTAYVADGAYIIGAVRLKEHSSVWYNAVLRGDTGQIEIGEYSNVQECVVISPSSGMTKVGSRTTIGAGSIVRSAIIGNSVLIGPRVIIMDGSRIEDGSIVSPGSFIPAGFEAQPGSYIAGFPAKVIGQVKPTQAKLIEENWRKLFILKDEYISGTKVQR